MQFIVIGPLGFMLFMAVWMQIPGKVLAGAFAVVLGIGLLVMSNANTKPIAPHVQTAPDPTWDGDKATYPKWAHDWSVIHYEQFHPY